MKLSKYLNLFDSFSGIDFDDEENSEKSSKVGEEIKHNHEELRAKLKVFLVLLSHSFVCLAFYANEFSKESIKDVFSKFVIGLINVPYHLSPEGKEALIDL